MRLLKITYQELVTEDREQMDVSISEHLAVSPVFNIPVKNYRLRVGMSATFHFKMAGSPLPKVSDKVYILSARTFTLFFSFLYTCF